NAQALLGYLELFGSVSMSQERKNPNLVTRVSGWDETRARRRWDERLAMMRMVAALTPFKLPTSIAWE
ncbi:hypothetical protein OFM52_31570, partial [Escherichia coli]|nr:hypothetical protein [Escherichia coli]